mmetsp:Transcript_1311/g.2883  ORF Transcript_1311/g.2883 Transcript_1311/m.2883 type:complete len:361 (+) Transcript_1311:639-1721(+)
MGVLKKSIMKRNRPGCCGTDGDGSDSRTFSNDDNAQNNHSSNNKKKTISFPETSHEFVKVVCEVPSIVNIDQGIRQQLWYSRSDFLLTKSTARVIAQESERYGLSKHLDHVYNGSTTEEDVDDHDNTHHQDHHVLQQRRHISSMWQDKLNLWALHGHSRRGLERLANSAHGNVRKDDQFRYQQVVLRAQREWNLTSSSTAAAGTGTAEIVNPFAEKLRQISTRMSHKARQFALMMGEADAHAARNGCCTSSAAVKYHSTNIKSLGSPYADGHFSHQQQPQGRLNRLSDLPRRSSTISSPSQHTHTTSMGGGVEATTAAIQPQFMIRTRTTTQNSAATTKSSEMTPSPPPSLSLRTTARMA